MARPCIHISMFFVVLLIFITSVFSRSIANQPIDLDKLSGIRAQLEKINRPGVKTIKSPDAFDLPELKDQITTLQQLEWPEGYDINKNTTTGVESFQLWSDSGEECPDGTVPILRITEQYLLRASNMTRFGQKNAYTNHEYATVRVKQDQFYGARTSINAWSPKVSEAGEFSLAQIWLASGTYDAKDLTTIEVGWHVFPDIYGGDTNPRLFGYWTRDAYEKTGCHNLVCPGFVQTDKRVALGAALSKSVSSYNGNQFDITLMVWKDPNNGNWWLKYGEGIVMGYWPASLLPRLKSHADRLKFGGEIVNFNRNGHTSTQMGSGHFAEEGFKKAAFFRNLNLVNSDGKVTPIPLSNLETYADHPKCYDIKVYSNKVYGTHFYFGGPGKNSNCP
ncbi:putative neprosin [Lupinus albus]|uniref:Putative neprosin n=1 Tax=Lupinus albus TaxID=3870 RepID=A0A6A4NW33_LUPAL|nr:putative neprosin [Lupinus albus]